MFFILDEPNFALIGHLARCFCVVMRAQEKYSYGDVTSMAGNGRCLQMCGSVCLLLLLAVVPADVPANNLNAVDSSPEDLVDNAVGGPVEVADDNDDDDVEILDDADALRR